MKHAVSKPLIVPRGCVHTEFKLKGKSGKKETCFGQGQTIPEGHTVVKIEAFRSDDSPDKIAKDMGIELKESKAVR